MIVTNQIKGVGNSFQQDRVGYVSAKNKLGKKVHLMWCADGHGRSNCRHRYDVGGTVSQIAHTELGKLTGDDIQVIYDTEFEGQRLYAHIYDKILHGKKAFFKSKGWKPLVDSTGDEIPGLWKNGGGHIVTGSGGTTLIILAIVQIGKTWKGRLYNVGDSFMIHNDIVFSQPGIDGLNSATVKRLIGSGNKTFYAPVPNSGQASSLPYHTIGASGGVTVNPVPSSIGGVNRYFQSNVRGDIAKEVCRTYTWRDFKGLTTPFEFKPRLASWSNMGDDQLPKWSAIPSYSKQFEITGPISLMSDGIGDILMNENPSEIIDDTSWFQYYIGHPMEDTGTDPSVDTDTGVSVSITKNSLFRNSWFHATLLAQAAAETPVEDMFYTQAKQIFGVADNISRVTFIPPV